MHKNIVAIILLLSCLSITHAQRIVNLKEDTWKGFERINFLIENHHAYYVKPVKPLEGRPWVWRASFPDWHTDMDSILLAKGFYVVYINADNQYGSPYALALWDKLYQYLTDSLSFANKPALEAVSRGALYAYGWAKRNPSTVSCIYAETPVCDIKSWPGGKLKSPGDTACWRQLKEVFSFTEEQAMAYNDNPVDRLEGLASFKVPILHIVGINDQLAPNEENTNVLAKRYLALGGPVSIYPVTTGPQELSGHHFPIEHPGKWADFIISNSYPVKNSLPYKNYVTCRNGLQNVYNAIINKKAATIAFLGGSITYNPGWRDKICAYLEEHYPSTQFRFIAAGIPSLGSLPHAFRLQRDVLDSGKVDLLFIESAVNDHVNGTDSITQVHALEGIVRHALKSNPLMNIVLMSFADPDKTSAYEKGQIPVEVANHELVAAHYGLPSVNLAKEIGDKLNNKEFSWQYDFKDLHPSPFGQELYFATIRELLSNCFAKAAASNEDSKPLTMVKPLNKFSLDNGKYVAVQNAKYNNGWVIDADWIPQDGLATREGFVHKPMLIADKPGATLSFDFVGNAAGIAVVSGADAGVISCWIDNEQPRKIDLYTQWSSFLHLPWYLLPGSDLKQKKHTLHIKIEDAKNAASKGNACRIVYFLVNS